MAEYFNDHPTYADSLDRIELIKEVGKHVQLCRPPQVVGVFGDWGSGKTSFMRSLEVYLAGVDANPTASALRNMPEEKAEFQGLTAITNARGTNPVSSVVWFEAWLYQAEDVPIVALLHEIRRQFGPGTQFWEVLEKSARIALESSLLALEPLAKAISLLAPVAGFFGKALGNVPKVAERVERDRFEVPLSSEQIRVQLNQAIKTILQNLEPQGATTRAHPRLTIIIDDLDRCEPAMAIRLLEGLKVFLNIEHCVFVLGVNPRRLTEHIANLYRGEAGAEDKGPDKYTLASRDYLDKIIGVHFTLGIAGKTNDLIKAHMPAVTVTSPTGDKDLKTDLETILLASPCLPPNPRRIKAYLATLSRYNGRTFRDEPEPVLLVAFAYLNHFHPEIIRKMQFYSEFHKEFFKWVMADQQTGDSSFTGLLPDPRYSGGDLKPGESKFPDPIYENLLHVHSLLREWAEGSSPLAEKQQLADDEANGTKQLGSQEIFGDYFLLA